MYLYQHDGFDPTVSSLNSNSPQMVEILHMWGLYAARLEFLSNGVLLHSLHSIKVWISIRNQCEGGGGVETPTYKPHNIELKDTRTTYNV